MIFHLDEVGVNDFDNSGGGDEGHGLTCVLLVEEEDDDIDDDDTVIDGLE